MLMTHVYKTHMTYHYDRQLNDAHSNQLFRRYLQRPIIMIDVRDAVAESNDVIDFAPRKLYNMSEAFVVVTPLTQTQLMTVLHDTTSWLFNRTRC